MSGPPAALSRRDDIASWLDDGDGLLLGLDFDGTLAPIVRDPDDAAITGRAKSIVGELTHHPEVTVAIISGRALDDLVNRVELDGPIYAGNHGLELADSDTELTHPAAEAHRSDIAELARELRDRLPDAPGAMVEHKGLTATVHFREAADPDEVASTVETVASTTETDVEVTRGRAVREVRPALDWGKDAAMRLLRSLAPDGHRPMYLGDDLTDEDAFEAIEDDGIGVRIGTETGPDTAATHQLSNQEQVPAFLDWVADYARDRWGGTTAPSTNRGNGSEDSDTISNESDAVSEDADQVSAAPGADSDALDSDTAAPNVPSDTADTGSTTPGSQRLLSQWDEQWRQSAFGD